MTEELRDLLKRARDLIENGDGQGNTLFGEEATNLVLEIDDYVTADAIAAGDGKRMARTLHEYLADCSKDGVIDFAFRAMPHAGGLQITIHPDGVNGDTVDYIVNEGGITALADTAG